MKVNFRYTGEYKSEYSQRIAELIEYILDQEYGATIGFEKCAKFLHYNIENEKELKKFKSTMSRVKNFLIDKGYVLKTVVGVGYYILKPKQISGYCYHTYIRKTENLIAKSQRILNHTDKTELSEIRMKEYSELKGLNERVGAKIEDTIMVSDYYKNKNYYDELED